MEKGNTEDRKRDCCNVCERKLGTDVPRQAHRNRRHFSTLDDNDEVVAECCLFCAAKFDAVQLILIKKALSLHDID